MQILRGHVRVGDRVIARGLRWRVADVRAFDECLLVSLAGAEPCNIGAVRQLLAPFDAIQPCGESRPGAASTDAVRRARRVSRRMWKRACRALLLAHTHAWSLRAAASAAIHLLPHQLEPALAIARGLGTRILIADEVGLGKTIQAGLIVAELLARGAVDRVLILTPAGLRDQWAGELSTRFGIAARVMDAREAARCAAALPVGLNPWTAVPIAIASLDYAKRPEVLPALSACRWDALVVDEAHGAVAGSDRHVAAASLCSRAAYTVLLTATPHNGDAHAFESLCGIGAHVKDPELLVFRRTRVDVAVSPARRICRQLVSPTAEERRVHQLLARLAAAVKGEDATLIMALLWKRALSSPGSLARSIERRLAGLSSTSALDYSQPGLPFDPSGDFDSSDDVPTWTGALLDDPERERRVLEPLMGAARAASRRESKVECLRRLLRRLAARRESAIVFTEYRDTLVHLQRELCASEVSVLHGGLSRHERGAAVAQFTAGPSRLLLATDAAAEGLNLHHRCRIAINLELPWNPMRLEQRIGRVDRLGQERRVHAVHLIARGTPEIEILARLRARLSTAGQAIGAADPLGFGTPSAGHAMARLVRLQDEAHSECERLQEHRRLSGRGAHARVAVDEPRTRPLVVRARKAESRARLGGRRLIAGRVVLHDLFGRHIASRAAGALVPDGAEQGNANIDVADGSDWECESRACHHRFWSVRLERERSIAAIDAGGPAIQYQPGLYDRRAERLHESEQVRRDVEQSDAGARVAAAEAAAQLHLTPWAPEIILEP